MNRLLLLVAVLLAAFLPAPAQQSVPVTECFDLPFTKAPNGDPGLWTLTVSGGGGDTVGSLPITGQGQGASGEVSLSWKSRGKEIVVKAVQGTDEGGELFAERVRGLVAAMERAFPPDPPPGG